MREYTTARKCAPERVASLPTRRSLIEKTLQGFSIERRVCSYAKSVFSGLPNPPLFHYVGKTSLMLLLTILKIIFYIISNYHVLGQRASHASRVNVHGYNLD